MNGSGNGLVSFSVTALKDQTSTKLHIKSFWEIDLKSESAYFWPFAEGHQGDLRVSLDFMCNDCKGL